MALTGFSMWGGAPRKVSTTEDHVTGFTTLTPAQECTKAKQKKDKKNRKKCKRQPSFTVPRNPYRYKYGGHANCNRESSTWTHYQNMHFRGALPQWTCMTSLNSKIVSALNTHEITTWLEGQKLQDSGRSAQRRPPPNIPKRDPETRLSGTSEQFSQDLKIMPHEMKFDSPLPAPDFNDGAPESGYITPEGSEVDYQAGTQMPHDSYGQGQHHMYSAQNSGYVQQTSQQSSSGCSAGSNSGSGSPAIQYCANYYPSSAPSSIRSTNSSRSNPPPPPPLSTLPADDESFGNHIPSSAPNGMQQKFYVDHIPNGDYPPSQQLYESVLPTPQSMAQPIAIVPPPPPMTDIVGDIAPVPPPPDELIHSPPTQFQSPPFQQPYVAAANQNGAPNPGNYHHTTPPSIHPHMNAQQHQQSGYNTTPQHQYNHAAPQVNGYHTSPHGAPVPPVQNHTTALTNGYGATSPPPTQLVAPAPPTPPVQSYTPPPPAPVQPKAPVAPPASVVPAKAPVPPPAQQHRSSVAPPAPSVQPTPVVNHSPQQSYQQANHVSQNHQQANHVSQSYQQANHVPQGYQQANHESQNHQQASHVTQSYQQASHMTQHHQQTNHVTQSYQQPTQPSPGRNETLPPPPVPNGTVQSLHAAPAVVSQFPPPPPPPSNGGQQFATLPPPQSPTKTIPRTMPKPKPKPSNTDASAAGIVQNELASNSKLPPVLARLQKPAESEPNRPAPTSNGDHDSVDLDTLPPPPPPQPVMGAKTPPPPPSKPFVAPPTQNHAAVNQHLPPPPPPAPLIGNCAPTSVSPPPPPPVGAATSPTFVVSATKFGNLLKDKSQDKPEKTDTGSGEPAEKPIKEGHEKDEPETEKAAEGNGNNNNSNDSETGATAPTDLTTMPAGRPSAPAPSGDIDVTTLPGYQEVPENLPQWKKALIERKNKELYEKAMSDVIVQQAEHEKWRDVPDWKKNLLQDKEKRKAEELAPYEADRRLRDEENHRLESMPEWKRNLILKKKGDM